MGVFNRAIPKYVKNPIDGSIVIEPVIEPVQVDDAFDPVLNKAVRERLMSTYGNPITATAAGYAELINNSLLGNKNQGGTMLPGIGILSGFGRTMDKAGDFILGGLTESVKGVTGQGIESPFYNIFVEDQDYSGQRLLAAAANSMAKMANAPELTEADFKGLWSLPSLGIELATDPSILGGNLSRIAKGQGAVAEAGKILQEYDDIMAKFAIDATAPGLRPLGKKFSNKIHGIVDNLRTEKELQDVILEARTVTEKAVIDFDNGMLSEEEFNKLLDNVLNKVNAYKKVADQDVIAQPLKQMAEDVERATVPAEAILTDKDSLAGVITAKIKSLRSYPKNAVRDAALGKSVKQQLDSRRIALGEFVDYLDKTVPYTSTGKSFVELYKNNPNLMFKDLGIYYDPKELTAKQYVPSADDVSALKQQIDKDTLDRNYARAVLKINGIRVPTESDALDIMWERLVPSKNVPYDVSIEDLKTLRKSAYNKIISENTSESEIIKALKTLGTPATYGKSVDLSKTSRLSKEFIHDPDYTVSKLLNILPSSFVDKYDITAPKDLVKLLQSDNEVILDDLEELFSSLVSKEGYGIDKVKVSQSMSKLNPEIQIRIANNVQQFTSDIVAKAVDLGIIDPKNISESTLDDLYDEIHSYITRPTFTGSKNIDDYLMLRHYSFSKNYLKEALAPYAEQVWSMSKYKPEFQDVRKRFSKSDPNDYSYYLDHIVGGVQKDISDFHTAHMSRLNSKSVTDLLDMRINPDVPFTYRDIANKFKKDDLLGTAKYSTRKKFEKLSSRKSVSVSEMLEEFGNFKKVIEKYNPDKPIRPKISPVLLNPKYLSNPTPVVERTVSKAQSKANAVDELVRFIKSKVDTYEKNISSQFAGRIDDESIGLVNAINTILKRVDFEDPIDVYRILNTRFKTSQGYKSLADLGIEVTRLPKQMSKKFQETRAHLLTKPIDFKGQQMSFVDVLDGKIDSILSNKTFTKKVYNNIISKKDYEKYFLSKLDIGYDSMYELLKNIPRTDWTRDGIVKRLSDPSLFRNMFNRYVSVETDPAVMYLNRLRPELGTSTFEEVSKVIDNSKIMEGVEKSINPPKPIKLINLNSAYEDNVLKAIDELPNEPFEQVVSNEWKLWQEQDLTTRADMLNKMFPNETPITAAELKLYDEFGKGGGSPVTRVIREEHVEKIRLYDILSKELRNNVKAKQDRDSVLYLPKIKEMLDSSSKLQETIGSANSRKLLTILDKQRGSVVKSTDFLTDLVLSDGVKLIAYDDLVSTDRKLLNNALKTINQNINAANTAAGGEVLKLIDFKNINGQRVLGYQLTGNQKLIKKLCKSKPTFSDIIFEEAIPLTSEELKFLEKYSPVTEHLKNVQIQASDYYTRLGFSYNDPDYFKHTFKNTEDWRKYVSEQYYKDIDTNLSEEISEMILNLDYLGDLRGQFGAIAGSRRFAGNISRYAMFDDNLEHITKSTFTKGVFANEKFQTTVSIFDNNDFKINKYCKNVDDIKRIIGSEANSRNLTIASVKYKNGMVHGFTKYDNFSDSSLEKVLNDENAVILPTHIFSTLDRFCKHRIRMSNKVYAFINRYLTAPFKIGVLLNPGFLLGNMSDAYLKQATTMANKYGTSVSEELTNVASSIRTTVFLNNKFTDIYDTYLKDLETYGVEIPANYKMSLQVSKNKAARDNFIKYMNGELKYYNKGTNNYDVILPSISNEDASISKVWIYLNAIQPTEGITKELAGTISGTGTGKLNYAKNPADRILYGLYNYKGKDIKTHGLLNNWVSKGTFAVSEGTESLARSSAILNDLKHQGIDLTEFGKMLDETDATEFRIKTLNAINAMHNANFDYNATSPLLEGIEGFVPFPTFWLKNTGYWFDMFINHPQYIDSALAINEGLWANEDVSKDKFKAEAKARGAIPLSAFGEQNSSKVSKFFRGIYKPSPLQSMFSAFNAINSPIDSLSQRTHPLRQGAGAAVRSGLNLTTDEDTAQDIRYRPYNTNQYQPNIDVNNPEFSPIKYTAHKLNPFDRTLNTALRTPGKVKRGEAQLSDFLPSVFQPDFSKK